MRKAYFKLRANIELDGDINIAEREINFFCSSFKTVSKEIKSKSDLEITLPIENVLSNARKNEIIGFIGILKNETTLRSLIIKTSFIQEIWLNEDSLDDSINLSKDYCEKVGNYYCIIPIFPMSEFLSYYKKKEIDSSCIRAFTKHLANIQINIEIEKVIRKSSTSTPHVHSLHKYKAKFFPRLIRSFLVTESDNKEDITVLDPFVGSGTALIESSFLGFNSVGVDIDLLSCLISESKSALLNSKLKEVKEDLLIYSKTNKQSTKYKFPSWISRKFERWGTIEEMHQHEDEISSITMGLENLNGSRNLFQTVISDAVTRKFNIRMMGTGVGRFALEIQKSSLNKIVTESLKSLTKTAQVLDILKGTYGITLQKPKVINGSATNLKFKDNSIDLILTSPPYLPASSGREDYLIGKSISITALGIMSEEQIKKAEKNSVGSMKNMTEIIENGLPDSVYKLYAWLKNDDLRKIKAEPTYSYYKDIKKALEESFRVLKKNGKAIYVIGKESVFYSFKTREVLYRVECDNIFQEIATEVGFEISDKVDIELNKKNKNARPRALDKYFETAFILRKP